VSVAYVGPGADADVNSPEVRTGTKLTIVEGDDLARWFDNLAPRQRAAAAEQPAQGDDAQRPEGSDAQRPEGNDAQPMEEN